jgi:hypothetical protein
MASRTEPDGTRAIGTTEKRVGLDGADAAERFGRESGKTEEKNAEISLSITQAETKRSSQEMHPDTTGSFALRSLSLPSPKHHLLKVGRSRLPAAV